MRLSMSPHAAPPLLRVRKLRVRLPQGAGEAVDGIDFDLQPGQTLALVGESGSGKSLTAAAILGLLPRGAQLGADELSFRGHNLLEMDAQGRRALRGGGIALVPQDAAASLNPARRIGAQMADVIGRVRGFSRQQAEGAALENLARLGLADPERCLQVHPHALSGGQRQRVLIAAALACAPRLLIADEPTSALDPATCTQLLHTLHRQAVEQGTALLLITHDLGLAARACEWLGVMYAGRLVEYGPAVPILQAPIHPYTEALLACRPTALPQGEPLRAIPGAAPPPWERPSGCAFHPRCALALARCRDHEPVLAVHHGRALRCHLAGLGR